MPKVTAPNKQYTGVSASVAFVNGVGETSDPALLQWFQDHGYEVEGAEENDADLDVLREKAKELGVENAERKGEKRLLEEIAAIEAKGGADNGG